MMRSDVDFSLWYLLRIRFGMVLSNVPTIKFVGMHLLHSLRNSIVPEDIIQDITSDQEITAKIYDNTRKAPRDTNLARSDMFEIKNNRLYSLRLIGRIIWIS